MNIRTEIIALEEKLKATIEDFEKGTRMRVSEVSVIHGCRTNLNTSIDMIRVKTSVGDYSEE